MREVKTEHQARKKHCNISSSFNSLTLSSSSSSSSSTSTYTARRKSSVQKERDITAQEVDQTQEKTCTHQMMNVLEWASILSQYLLQGFGKCRVEVTTREGHNVLHCSDDEGNFVSTHCVFQIIRLWAGQCLSF